MQMSKVHFECLSCQAAQIKVVEFRCANRSDEPLNIEIVFSKGFHDFQSLISTAQKSFNHFYLCSLPQRIMKMDF